jgi:hypothetical protein
MSAKQELEFQPAEQAPWTPVPGEAAGMSERILAAADREAGVVTRMLRFEPGTDTTANGTLTHDFWEEVYMLVGDLTDLRLGETFTAGMYACRPPGMEHGPWKTEQGCTTFEVRYREPRDG